MEGQKKLYRVLKRYTGSLQPGGGATFWQYETLYCGYSCDEARQAYYSHAPEERFNGYGGRAIEVVYQEIEGAGDPCDDTITTVDVT